VVHVIAQLPVLSATLALSGVDNYTGGTTVSAGTLLVNGSDPSAVAVSAGATLGGVGTVGAVTSSGTVAPGTTAGSTGTLTTGNLTPGPGMLSLDLTSATAYDRISASAVNLSSATLSINAGMSLTTGNSFTIISVAGTSGGVTGTFNSLANGATLTVGTLKFTINYAGGDGNDVVLTLTSTPILLGGKPTLNGGLSTIDSTLTTKQHSMVENVTYSFSQAVSLSTSNFTLTGLPGTTTVPNVNLVSSSGGAVWTVTFSGAGVNNATHSIGDGEYGLVLSGVAGVATSTFDFFRLLGDMDGNGTVDSADFSIFISSFLRGTTDPAYLGADDFDGNNTVDSSDFSIFVSNFLHSLPNTTSLN
jgi:hypothetical protein